MHLWDSKPALPHLVFNRCAVYPNLGIFLFGGLVAAALATGWWATVRAPALLARTDNPRRTIADRWVLRGSILDRNLESINASYGQPGSYIRQVLYPDLSNVVGYTDPTYGQAGLEASLDEILRGLQGVSSWDSWWNHLAYGQPPPGLNVRLSLDLQLQKYVDEQLGQYQGAAVLFDAANGEMLAVASHPTFDANQLSQDWQLLVDDPHAPLLNCAIQGRYPLGELETALFPQGFASLGLDEIPTLYLDDEQNGLPPQGYSPLQVAWAGAVISNEGLRPGPKLVTGYQSSQGDWVVLPALEPPKRILPASDIDQIVAGLTISQGVYWETVQVIKVEQGPGVTWYVGGTIPGWEGQTLSLVLLLEGETPDIAQKIGQAILLFSTQ